MSWHAAPLTHCIAVKASGDQLIGIINLTTLGINPSSSLRPGGLSMNEFLEMPLRGWFAEALGPSHVRSLRGGPRPTTPATTQLPSDSPDQDFDCDTALAVGIQNAMRWV
ncbi:hypothetical protein OQA88_8569 [Cercophora sp. LCS_1]